MLSLVVVLLGCSGPPPLATTTAWQPGPCGETGLRIEVRTAPTTPVKLTGLDLEVVSDEAGLATFAVPGDAMLSNARVVVGESSVEVEPAPGALIHRFGAGVFSTSCLGAGASTRACQVNVSADTIFAGNAEEISVAGVSARPSEALPPTLPLSVAHLAHWDLGVAAEADCPAHVAVRDVEVRARNQRFVGEAWVAIDAARQAVGGVLGAPDARWDAAPTGEVTLVVRRSAPDAPARFVRFVGDPGPLTDIRYVASLTRRAEDLGSCGTYVDRATGATMQMHKQRVDLEVALRDRASGEVLASTQLQGEVTPCERVAVTASPYGSDSFRAEEPVAAADAWVDAELAKRR